MLREQKARFGGMFTVWAYDRAGNLLWEDTAKNLVPNPALQYLIDAAFNGGSQVSSWFLAPTGDSPVPDPTDTMAVHGGWTEVTAYSELTHPAYTGVRTNQTESNSAAKASFSINVKATHLGGAYLTSNGAKSGATGTLMCVAPFTLGNKVLNSGDTLVVQYSFTAADDGI